MLFPGIKTLGISILVMLVTSLLGILLIQDVLMLSIVSFLFTYSLNGYIAAMLYHKYPYFLAYMTSFFLIIMNLLFAQFVVGLDVFLNPNIIFYSLLVGTLTSLLGAYVNILFKKRRAAHA
ncbi:hypothetical protein [Bacillus sp. B15-48]|uniref:hypothetical protein n=1 Tax=Bacillus sp. B15-48 TaxID=1548601 RepID=UPI00193F7ABC|nr:hypothetical protein [Bacillus sp. B15-48]MBM4763250.1 hypothetical protein [Bacillus sp. B15-48]